jgi:hypothetical protein
MTRPPRDILPPLSGERPQDVYGHAPRSAADTVLYRLGLHSLPVPGLPAHLTVSDVKVDFIKGPMRAQKTSLRQRHGLPIAFDKHMARPEVGEGECLALLTIPTSPVPSELRHLLPAWRAKALQAAGLVAAILDERVVGAEIFEDALLLANEVCVGAIDHSPLVRSHVPLEVNAADVAGLAQLADIAIDESSRAARAARSYRRAVVEGPTADAFAMLWIAAESLSDTRTPSRPDIEDALREAGVNPDGLPLHVGLLIDLRGKIQHHGLESVETLATAFYEMEAIVRVLIRREMGIANGWWPALDPGAFVKPFATVVANAMRHTETRWHNDGLPPVDDHPDPMHLPRQVARPHLDPRLRLDPGFGENLSLIASVIIDAIEWQSPDATLAIHLGLPPSVPGDTGIVSSAEGIWIPTSELQGLDDPERPGLLINFVWNLFYAVGAAIAQQCGVASEGDGTLVVAALAGRAQYVRLVRYGDYPASMITMPAGDTPEAVGRLTGWAAAGDDRARSVIEELRGEYGDFCRELATVVATLEMGPPFHLLPNSA